MTLPDLVTAQPATVIEAGEGFMALWQITNVCRAMGKY